MPIHYAAPNAWGNSNNENALTELAAEASLHPISSFAVKWRWRRRPQAVTPLGVPAVNGCHTHETEADDSKPTLRSLVPDAPHVYQCGLLESELIYVREGQSAPEFEPESWFQPVQNERKKIAVRGDHCMPAALRVHDPANGGEAARLRRVVRFAPTTCRRRRQPRRLDGGLEIHPRCDDKFSLAKISHDDRLQLKTTRKEFDGF